MTAFYMFRLTVSDRFDGRPRMSHDVEHQHSRIARVDDGAAGGTRSLRHRCGLVRLATQPRRIG